jgi:hypothetical protein
MNLCNLINLCHFLQKIKTKIIQNKNLCEERTKKVRKSFCFLLKF